MTGLSDADRTHQWRAEQAEAELDRLRTNHVKVSAVLAEVLSLFTQKGHPGTPCRRTGWIDETTVARWHQTYREATS